jgi:predicted enzyme related to lactoylglutathione lyase
MHDVSDRADGTFCWVGLASSDPGDASRFYTSLFGWRAEDISVGPMGTCTFLRHGEKNAAILYGQTREARLAHAPPHWTSFILTPDVNASLERARELGATVIRAPFDLIDIGRAAALRDPVGAIVSLWQHAPQGGAASDKRDESLAWNELATSDIERAKSFYADLFAWEYATSGAAGYTTIENRLGPVGGMREHREHEHGLPSDWLPYFVVESAEGTVRRAEQLGGVALSKATLDRSVVITDRQGAAFAVAEAAEVAKATRRPAR